MPLTWKSKQEIDLWLMCYRFRSDTCPTNRCWDSRNWPESWKCLLADCKVSYATRSNDTQAQAIAFCSSGKADETNRSRDHGGD